MKRTNPSGRTPLLGDGGKPIGGSGIDAQNFTPRLKAKPHRAGTPLSHGKHSQAQADAWDAEGLWRREGHDPVPSWQRTMRAGCCRCMARPGILPADHERARGMMLEWGWRWGGGMWLCKTCVDEREQE